MFLSLSYLQEISFVAQKYSECNFSLLKRKTGYHSSTFLFEINWQFLPMKERFMFGFLHLCLQNLFYEIYCKEILNPKMGVFQIPTFSRNDISFYSSVVEEMGISLNSFMTAFEHHFLQAFNYSTQMMMDWGVCYQG